MNTEREWVEAREAGRLLGGLSRSTVYRLADAGRIRTRRPSPRRLQVMVISIEQHLKNVEDPEYWRN